MEYFDEFYATLWGEWNWSQAKKNRFRSSCNSFRTRLYNELNVHFDDDHPTMKHFSSARWFNIDTAADFPESARNALTNVPWAWNYYESDPAKQRQLQREWVAHITDEFPAVPDDFNPRDNGERCLDYFNSKREAWPLLYKIARRSLNVVVSTADVERIFSKFTYYFSRLDAVSLGPDHKRARAFIIQNKDYV